MTDIKQAYQVLNSMNADFYNKGEFSEDDLKRVEKFYLHPELKFKFMKMLASRVGYDPFAQEPIERPLQNGFERLPLHEVKELPERPLCDIEKSILSQVDGDPETLVLVYTPGPSRLPNDEIFEPGLPVDLIAKSAEHMCEINERAGLHSKLAWKFVPAKHLYCAYDQFSVMQVYYEPRE